MKGILRGTMTAVGLVLIAIALAALLLVFQGGSAIKNAAAGMLSRAYGAEAQIESVDLDPLNGEIAIRGLSIANPPGFSTGDAVRLERVDLRADVKSLLTKNPVFEEIVLRDALLNVRYEAGAGVNLQKLLRNARERAEGGGGEGAGQTQGGSYLVRELRSEGARVQVSANLLPGSQAEFEVKPFAFSNVSSENPLGASELAAKVLGGYIQEMLGLKGLLSPIASFFEDAAAPEEEEPGPIVMEGAPEE
jgi:uncharacterized protein involved in outer membrane biogenesis